MPFQNTGIFRCEDTNKKRESRYWRGKTYRQAVSTAQALSKLLHRRYYLNSSTASGPPPLFARGGVCLPILSLFKREYGDSREGVIYKTLHCASII